jgi:hypothetical protein
MAQRTSRRSSGRWRRSYDSSMRRSVAASKAGAVPDIR